MSSQESGVAVASWNVLGRAPARPGRELRHPRMPRRRRTRSRDHSRGVPCASGSGPRPARSPFPARYPRRRRSGTPTVRCGGPPSRRPVLVRRSSGASPASRPAQVLPTRHVPKPVARSRLRRRGPRVTGSRPPRPVPARANLRSRGTSRARRRVRSPRCRRRGAASLPSLLASAGRARGRIVRRWPGPRLPARPPGGRSARASTVPMSDRPVRARLLTRTGNRCGPPSSGAAGHAPPPHRPRWSARRRVRTHDPRR